jgi:hypothetical protein
MTNDRAARAPRFWGSLGKERQQNRVWRDEPLKRAQPPKALVNRKS